MNVYALKLTETRKIVFWLLMLACIGTFLYALAQFVAAYGLVNTGSNPLQALQSLPQALTDVITGFEWWMISFGCLCSAVMTIAGAF